MSASDEFLQDHRDCIEHMRELESSLAAARAESKALADAAEMLWIVLANVSGGDWSKQTREWEEAAERWRDNYFKVIRPSKGQGEIPKRP